MIDQKILYIISTSIIMVSSIIYSLGALFTCLDEGFTIINTGSFVGNLLYIVGYLADIIAESIRLYKRRSKYFLFDFETASPVATKLYTISSMTFAVSAVAYVIVSLDTCLTSGFDKGSITTLASNSMYTIGCIIYSVAIAQKSTDTKNSLVNRTTMQMVQHLDF